MDSELEDALYNASPMRSGCRTPGDKGIRTARRTVIRFLEGVAELGQGGETVSELLDRLRS